MGSRLAMAKQYSWVGVGYLRDMTLPPMATTPDQVPSSPTSLTAEWLIAALCGDTGARVASIRVAPISDGST